MRKYYKDIEHFTIKYVTGKEVDTLLKQSEDYINRMKKLFKQIDNKFSVQRTHEFYNNFETVMKRLLETENIKYRSLKDGLNQLIKKHLISKSLESQFNAVLKLQKPHGVSKQEIEKIKRENASFIRTLDDIANRNSLLSAARSTLHVAYSDNKRGEVVFCRDRIFMIKDSDKKEKEFYSMTFDMKDHKFGSPEKATIELYDQHMKERKTINTLPVTDELFKRFKKAFGDDVKIVF